MLSLSTQNTARAYKIFWIKSAAFFKRACNVGNQAKKRVDQLLCGLWAPTRHFGWDLQLGNQTPTTTTAKAQLMEHRLNFTVEQRDPVKSLKREKQRGRWWEPPWVASPGTEQSIPDDSVVQQPVPEKSRIQGLPWKMGTEFNLYVINEKRLGWPQIRDREDSQLNWPRRFEEENRREHLRGRDLHLESQKPAQVCTKEMNKAHVSLTAVTLILLVALCNNNTSFAIN